MVKRWMLLIVLISLFSIDVSANVNFTYKTDLDGFSVDIYDCKGDCVTNTNPEFVGSFSSAGNSVLISLNPSNYLAVFYKDCYMPGVKADSVTDSYEGISVSLDFYKKQDCSALLEPIAVSGSKLVNESITITGKIKSHYTVSEFGIVPGAAQQSRANFFKGDSAVDFYINDEIVDSLGFNLGADESQQFSFVFTPSKKDVYDIKLVSKADDCKCLSKIENTEEHSLSISEPYTYQQQQIKNITKKGRQETGLMPIVGSCDSDWICNTNCINGDADCSCSSQEGFVCKEGEECIARLLKNWEEVICCSRECVKSVLVDNESNIKTLAGVQADRTETFIGSVKRFDIKQSKEIQYSLGILVLAIVIFSIFISFTLHHFGEEAGFVAGVGGKVGSGTREYFHFLGEEGLKTINFFRKGFSGKKKIKVEKPKGELKQVKLNPLIVEILDTLYGDEEVVFKIVLDSEGIKKEDVREQLGWDRIRMEQALIKLDRKQLIKKKGSEENPKIYVHDWLK